MFGKLLSRIGIKAEYFAYLKFIPNLPKFLKTTGTVLGTIKTVKRVAGKYFIDGFMLCRQGLDEAEKAAAKIDLDGDGNYENDWDDWAYGFLGDLCDGILEFFHADDDYEKYKAMNEAVNITPK